MSAPEEIVCETVEAFRNRLRDAVNLTAARDPLPGDAVTFNGRAYVYRPPAPKPVSMEAAERKAFEEWGWKNGYDPTNSTLCFEAWKGGRSYAPPPPRDEAWDAWLAGNIYRFGHPHTQSIAHDAFLAGRASVKP